MSDSVLFPAAAVRRHATAVSAAADQMSQARSAVHTVAMDTEAYGQLCQFLPGLLSPVFEAALEVLDEATDSLGETSSKLRTTADEIEASDTDSAGRMTAAGVPGWELPL
jgi:hypothetical protein